MSVELYQLLFWHSGSAHCITKCKIPVCSAFVAADLAEEGRREFTFKVSGETHAKTNITVGRRNHLTGIAVAVVYHTVSTRPADQWQAQRPE